MLRIFIAYNEEDLQVPELEITSDMAMDYCKFMNELMAEVYDLSFQERSPRVFLDMNRILQFSHIKRIGDRFMEEFRTIIRLYDFVI